MRRTLLVHLDSALLVGGYASATGFLDATTAVDREGTPVIPASALKGALREAVTRLYDGCTLVAPCEKDPCLACRLFGGPGTGTESLLEGAEVHNGRRGKLYVGQARPKDRAAEDVLRRSLTARTGVSIDRQQRSAVPGLLFQREIADAPGSLLIAEIEGDADEGEWQKLERALALLDGIGNSRSRGLGHVHVTLGGEPGVRRDAHVFPSEAPAGGMALVAIEALESLVLGDLPPASNFIESLGIVRGSALRGMLGNAATRLGREAAFQRIFLDPDRCLLFSDALPSGPADALVIPAPRSSLECKLKRRKDHLKGKPQVVAPPVDGLVGSALLDHLFEERGGAPVSRRCPICDGPLQRAEGFFPDVTLDRRIVTRLARDVATGSAMPGMLYSVEQIEVGARFVGTVARLSSEALDLLRALAGADLRVGRGRSRGQGRVRLKIIPARDDLGTSSVEARTKLFCKDAEAVRPELRAPSGKPAGSLVAVLARTDVACDPKSAPETIARALFANASVARPVATFQTSTSRSGWDEGRAPGSRAGYRPAAPTVSAGSAWLFACEPGATLDAARIARAEVEGVGSLCELGMGRIVVNHALFKQGR